MLNISTAYSERRNSVERPENTVQIAIWAVTKNTRTKIAKQTQTETPNLRENATLAGEISHTTKIQNGQNMYLSKNVCRLLLVEALYTLKHHAPRCPRFLS